LVEPVETLAKEVKLQPFRITVEDVETGKEPFSVTYKLAVHSANGEHRLSKSYNDLERLGEALIVELPTARLPRLPRPLAHERLVDRGFRARLGAYLICLACNQSVVETFTFNNFFQLAKDVKRRWQIVRSAMQRRRDHPSSGKVPMQGGAGMGGSISPVGGSIHAVSPVKLSMSVGLPAGPEEREHAGSETLQAAAQVPVDSRPPQGPTSISEPSATPAIASPRRRKTTRGRAWCVVCLENPQEMAIDPCGHMSMCEECMKSVNDCPICRGPMQRAMKIIIAKRHSSSELAEYVTK